MNVPNGIPHLDTPPRRHVYRFTGKDDDSLIVEEELADRAILLGLDLPCCVLMQISSIE